MLYNPKYNRTDYDGRLGKYQDRKRWKQIIGAE